MKRLHFNLITLACVTLFGCENPDGIADDAQTRDYSTIFTPLPSKTIYPSNNPYSETKERLGELLFWDPILSGDKDTSCASCHHPDFGWADGRILSIGSDGIGLGPQRYGFQVTSIHAPTIMNVAYTGIKNNESDSSFVSGGYFWDLRADTLEEQSLGPIKNPVEMLGYNNNEKEIMADIVERLRLIPEYVTLFEQAFGVTEAVSSENIVKAIATFERKITSPNTRFDRFLSGEQSIFTQQEIIGLNKFIDGGCARCHLGPMLSDNILHLGEAIIGTDIVRTPSLRNISYTAPYMHDGSRARLIDAIADYENRGDLDVTIGEDDFADIEAFLQTVNTDDFYKGIPTIVPSGLTVGGNIN
ncbi:cytochrome-c peroxidase [Colwellia psychrerythraea]|uniref:Di-hem cytochrome c peroxidase n=1 Tax=Colwellia psychrerythraea (strain 34H / ATCC BAA-681) TaxID=167879 RepID=Q484C5_COLP3|nr:cytochrome-c peroxidase [Colwellia psychrerythraea]AAZ24753.1 di-hem cytochrome c peroxidase [Colwellia psychrerythraea 34H]